MAGGTRALCSEGDGKPVHSRGLCQPCYRRLLRNGTTEKQGQKILTVDVVAKCSVLLGSGCREWTGSTDSTGYPRFYVTEGQKLINVRRWLMQEHGCNVEGKHVEDTCGNKACVRPEHLIVVDPHTTTKTEAGKQRVRAIERGDVCDKGHPWLPKTTYFYPEGGAFAGKKACKICRMNLIRARQHRPPVDSIGPWNRDKTHCPQGHAFDNENTFFKPDGARGCKVCNNASRRRVMYGTEPEDIRRMLEEQQNCCLICEVEFTAERPPHVDHDHSCCPGKKSCGDCVRGLLCNNCNNGLGRFKDSVKSLRAAIAYLESTHRPLQRGLLPDSPPPDVS